MIFCSLTNKDTIKHNKDSVSLTSDSKIIISCRNSNSDNLKHYITPYKNMFDNSVSIIEFDVCYKTCIQKRTCGTLNYTSTDHE